MKHLNVGLTAEEIAAVFEHVDGFESAAIPGHLAGNHTSWHAYVHFKSADYAQIARKLLRGYKPTGWGGKIFLDDIIPANLSGGKHVASRKRSLEEESAQQEQPVRFSKYVITCICAMYVKFSTDHLTDCETRTRIPGPC